MNSRAPPRIWDEGDREAAQKVIRDTIRNHDDQAVPIIQGLRPWYSWRAIADRLNLAGLEPPGSRYKHRVGERPGRSWSHVAVRRIAQRNGIA